MPWDRNAPKADIYKTAKHRRARAEAVRAYRPGDPCAICWHEMWPPVRYLHLHHDPLSGDYLGLTRSYEPAEG